MAEGNEEVRKSEVVPERPQESISTKPKSLRKKPNLKLIAVNQDENKPTEKESELDVKKQGN